MTDVEDRLTFDPVTDLDELRAARVSLFRTDGVVTPLQPAEIRAGLTDADVDAQINAARNSRTA